MTIFTLTNIGLMLDIIGAIIIFKYGLPSAETRSIHALSFSDPTEKEIKDIKVSKIMSPAGILTIILGFFLQLIGNILYIR